MSSINRLHSVCVLLVLLALALTACNSGQAPKPTTAAPTSATAATAAAPQPTALPPAIAPTSIPPTVEPTAIPLNIKSATFNQFSFDYDLSLATDVAAAVVPGFTDPSAPDFAIFPDTTQFNFSGYKSINQYHQPVIEVYAVADYEQISDHAKTVIADLKQLLIDQPASPDKSIPHLPIFNATEIFHAQVQYLKFNSGVGVRFIAQYDQAYLPVSNVEIVYLFQGITNDGQYYISARLPVTHRALPNSDQMTPELQTQMADVEAYYKGMAQKLNEAKAVDYAPNLNLLDAMLQSLRVK